MNHGKDLSLISVLCRWLLIVLVVVVASFVGSDARNHGFAATESEPMVLIYEVDPASLAKGEKIDMENLVAAVKQRVNPGGQKEVVVRQRAVDQIEIIIPNIDAQELARLKRIIASTGSLEFRILANRRNNKDLIERALAEPSNTKLRDSRGKLLAWWVPVKAEEQDSITTYSDIALRTKTDADNKTSEVLVVPDDYNVTGAYLGTVSAAADTQGRPCVSFAFTKTGGKLFGKLTGSHLPDEKTHFTYKLGIIFDGRLVSAPAIQSTIYDRGEIIGSFTKEQVDEYVRLLSAGSLPAKIRPVKK